MLRIVRINEVVGSGRFLAEDVFSEEDLQLSISGKMRMALAQGDLQVGDECVAMFSPYEPTRGRVVTPSSFKMDNHNDNWNAQGKLKARYEKEIGPYETDYNWFHRPVQANVIEKPIQENPGTTLTEQITSKIIDLRKSLDNWLKP